METMKNPLEQFSVRLKIASKGCLLIKECKKRAKWASMDGNLCRVIYYNHIEMLLSKRYSPYFSCLN